MVSVVSSTHQTFHLPHSELAELWVGGHPGVGGDEGHHQPHHGDLPARGQDLSPDDQRDQAGDDWSSLLISIALPSTASIKS